MKRIGIIGAMEVEVANLKQAMKNEKIIRKASVEFYEGEIAGKEVVIARSGVGKVNAAICAQIMIDLFGIDILLNTGIAGSLSAQIDIGAALRSLAEEVCCRVNPDIRVHQGRIVSGDQFVSDQKVKEDIVHTFGGFAVEMEGAAIGQTAYVNGIPFLIIRAISDKADGSAHMDYPVFEAKAALHSTNLTLGLIGRL